MNALVLVRGLRFTYPDGTAALRGVDFRLEAGETVALLGANGSGKTTFALHLNGLLSGEGEIVVAGLPVREPHLAAVRRKVGFLFQDPDEQLFLPTVLEDAAFGPRQAGLTSDASLAAARSALTRVGLPEETWNKPPYHLSAGQKQRAALAGVLAMNPELLVLDEPTTHLDPPGRRRLAALLETLPQAKIVVTHDLAFARRLAQRAVFFEEGAIVADGPLGEVATSREWNDPPAGI
jgi:cobalt/nickel transport system ATP-binding protein